MSIKRILKIDADIVYKPCHIDFPCRILRGYLDDGLRLRMKLLVYTDALCGNDGAVRR